MNKSFPQGDGSQNLSKNQHYPEGLLEYRRLGLYIDVGFPSVVKTSPAEADVGLIPELERSLEKEMVIHSSVLAWEIPWTEESGGLQSMRLQSWR